MTTVGMTPTRYCLHIKPSGELKQAVETWQKLRSCLVFETNGHLIKVSGPPEVFNPFKRFLRGLQEVNGRYLHFLGSEATTKEVTTGLTEIFPEIDVAHIYGQTILVREGEQGSAFLKALGDVVDIGG